MATQNIQLKDGQGNLLMPKTKAEIITKPVTFYGTGFYGYRFYINATTNKWVGTSITSDYNAFINKVAKGDLITITPNEYRGAAVAFLDDISDISDGADASYVTWHDGVKIYDNVTDIICESDCWLYILNFASNSSIIRYPDAIDIGRKSSMGASMMDVHIVGSIGRIYADNTNDKFIVGENIVFKSYDGNVTIPKGTEIPYDFTAAQINYLCYNVWKKEFTIYSWAYQNFDELILLSFRVLNSKVVDDLGSPVKLSIINDSDIIYHGEKPIISENKINRIPYVTLPTFPGYTGLHQAMGINGVYAVLLTYNDKVSPHTSTAVLYNITTSQKLAEINLPYSIFSRPHGNSCTFGSVYRTSDSVLPLMYVSQWEESSERGCLVYDIQLNGDTYTATLVQSIVPNLSDNIFGGGASDWIVDGGYIYSIAYRKPGGAYIDDNNVNPTMICKFSLPDTANPEVILTDVDIIDNFTTESTPFRQSSIICNGKIIIQAGIINYPNWMWLKFIDVESRKITTKIPLVAYGGEPEGLGIFDGNLLMGWRNDPVLYKIIFK